MDSMEPFLYSQPRGSLHSEGTSARADCHHAELAALRKENADLRSRLATDTARLQGVANEALRECVDHRMEIKRLREAGVGPAAQPQSNSDLVEAMRELERMELALLEERRKTEHVLEEKREREDMHARDIAMLENMMQSVLQENEKLESQIRAWEVTKLDAAGGIRPERQVCGDPAQSADDAASDHDEPDAEPRRD